MSADFPVLVKVALPDGVVVTVAGERIAPGLVITPAVYSDSFAGGWALTHEVTGYAIAQIAACIACIRVAAPLLRPIDWTRDEETLKQDQQAIAAAHGFRRRIELCDLGCSTGGAV